MGPLPAVAVPVAAAPAVAAASVPALPAVAAHPVAAHVVAAAEPDPEATPVAAVENEDSDDEPVVMAAPAAP